MLPTITKRINRIARCLDTSSNRFFSSLSQLNQTWNINLNTFKSKTAIIQDDFEITYDELHQRSISLYYMFKDKYNLQKGDIIIHLSQQRIDDLQIMMASAKLGTNITTLDPSWHQIDYVIQLSKPKLIITEPDMVKHIKDQSINTLVLSPEFDPNNWLANQYMNYNENNIENNVSEYDRHNMVFTSGTTGLSKGCVYSHKCIYEQSMVAFEKFVDEETKWNNSTLVLTPLVGAVGPVQRWSVLLYGNTIVYPNKYQAKSAAHWHYLCEEKHCNIRKTVMFGRTLSDIYHLNKPFHNLKYLIFSGDFIPFKTVANLKKQLFGSDTKFIHGYGCSEAYWISMLNPDILNEYVDNFNEDTMVNLPVGEPINENVKIKIAADGEVLVKKLDETSMIEYFNAPQLTNEVITNDGYVHTGDIGYIDENDGLLYLQGRKKDIIKGSVGRNISPVEIEIVLSNYKYVKEVAVVGYPNSLEDESLSGEVPVAFVSLNDNTDLSMDEIKSELMALCLKSLQPEFMVKDIYFMDELPKTKVRKMDKNLLRQQFVR